jgi:hypothetical protein
MQPINHPTFLDLRLKNFELDKAVWIKYSFFTKGIRMSEVSKGQIQTTALDHLGLVAAICQDLKIAQRIDDRLPCDSQRKVITSPRSGELGSFEQPQRLPEGVTLRLSSVWSGLTVRAPQRRRLVKMFPVPHDLPGLRVAPVV